MWVDLDIRKYALAEYEASKLRLAAVSGILPVEADSLPNMN